jgi:hypothetical protein
MSSAIPTVYRAGRGKGVGGLAGVFTWRRVLRGKGEEELLCSAR